MIFFDDFYYKYIDIYIYILLAYHYLKLIYIRYCIAVIMLLLIRDGYTRLHHHQLGTYKCVQSLSVHARINNYFFLCICVTILYKCFWAPFPIVVAMCVHIDEWKWLESPMRFMYARDTFQLRKQSILHQISIQTPVVRWTIKRKYLQTNQKPLLNFPL